MKKKVVLGFLIAFLILVPVVFASLNVYNNMNSDEVEDTSIVETDNESDVVIDSSVTTNA